MRRIIVVGAGTAGCIVAARLSEDPENNVLLLEAGPDRASDSVSALKSANWLNALHERSAFYSDLLVRKLPGTEPKLYQRGTGVGGSASVNAMLALPGLPHDYDRWASEFGCTRWKWSEVSPWFDRLKSDLAVSREEEITPVDHALMEAAEVFGLSGDVDTYTPEDGGGLLWRNANERGRFSSLERYLEPARTRGNLAVRAGSQVERLNRDRDRITGVRLASGEELSADEVVLCAGVFETPAILLRTGFDHPGIGRNLQDHPAASIYFTLKPGYRATREDGPCIGAVMRLSSTHGIGDIHLLPLHGTLLNGSKPDHGLLMAALMKVTSVGELRLSDNPLAPPVVDERMLSTPEDMAGMRDAIDCVKTVLAAPSFQEIVEESFIDEHGTPVHALDDRDFFESWLRGYVGDYFHACGTARMGTESDPNAVVDEEGRVHGAKNLRVIDASIMPEVPSANTHLPTAMLAERITSWMLSGSR